MKENRSFLKKIVFVTALDLNKCLGQIKSPRFLLMYATISELPSTISTMAQQEYQ